TSDGMGGLLVVGGATPLVGPTASIESIRLDPNGNFLAMSQFVGNLPSPLVGHGAAMVGGSLYVMGGLPQNGPVTNQAIAAPIPAVTPPPPPPPPPQPVVVASGQDGPMGIAVDSNNVYWTNQMGGQVMRAPLSGSGYVAIAFGQGHPTDIAIDASNAYFTNAE